MTWPSGVGDKRIKFDGVIITQNGARFEPTSINIKQPASDRPVHRSFCGKIILGCRALSGNSSSSTTPSSARSSSSQWWKDALVLVPKREIILKVRIGADEQQMNMVMGFVISRSPLQKRWNWELVLCGTMVGPLILQHSKMHHICQWNMQELPGFILKHSEPCDFRPAHLWNRLRLHQWLETRSSNLLRHSGLPCIDPNVRGIALKKCTNCLATFDTWLMKRWMPLDCLSGLRTTPTKIRLCTGLLRNGGPQKCNSTWESHDIVISHWILWYMILGRFDVNRVLQSSPFSFQTL